MRRIFLKAKLHGVMVTMTQKDYEGSLCLDESWLQVAGLLPYEKVHVYNLTSGERFSTYLIKGEKDSGVCGVYGAAAHKAKVGDKLIIVAYTILDEGEVEAYSPRIVIFTSENRVKEVK